MKHCKRIIGILLGMTMIISLTACGGGASSSLSSNAPAGASGKNSSNGTAAQIVFKAGQESDPTNSYGTGLEKLAELVKEKTNGRYKLDVYHSGQLGTERELIEGVKMGTVDIAAVTSSPMTGFVADYGVFDMPYLFTSLDQAYKTLGGEIGDEYLAKLKSVNIVGLKFWTNGFRDMTNSKRPITSPDDLKGLKMRVMQSSIQIATFEALGAIATPMAYGEVYTSLQQKTVDGQETPIMSIVSAKFYEPQKYLSITEHFYSPALLLMSESAYAKIAPEDLPLFKEAVEEATKFQQTETERKCQEGLKVIEDYGLKVNEVPDKSAFIKAVEPVYDKFSKDFGDTIDRIRAQSN